MINQYEKVCLEYAIKKKDSKNLVKLLSIQSNDYQSMINFFPKNDKIKSNFFSIFEKELYNWLRSKDKNEMAFDCFTSKENIDALFYIQLKNITRLKTDFGKKHSRACGYFSIYSFGRNKNFSEVKKSFYDFYGKAIEKIFKLPNTPRIVEVATINKQFGELNKKYGKESTYEEVSQNILKFLRDSLKRNVILRTKQASGTSIENIAKSIGIEVRETRPLIKEGVKNGLLILEYDVKCDSCGKVIARVPLRESITRLMQQRVHCSNCNKPISEKDYDEIYIVSDTIVKLIEGSRWMSIDVKNKLGKIGFLVRNILTEITDGPNQLDVIANLDGEFVLMELKDSQFSIGHAYSFVGKCTKYKPDISIIIATGGIGPEVKDYLKGTGFNPILIESLDNFEEDLERIFSKYHAIRLIRLMSAIPNHLSRIISKIFEFEEMELLESRELFETISYLPYDRWRHLRILEHE